MGVQPTRKDDTQGRKISARQSWVVCAYVEVLRAIDIVRQDVLPVSTDRLREGNTQRHEPAQIDPTHRTPRIR